MSGQIIDNSPVDDNNDFVTDVAVVAGKPVSLQVVQQIYKELTGQSEKISKSYKEDIRLSFEDISQLNRKVEQALEQYHIKFQNCTISVFYSDDTHDDFNSFDRFSFQKEGLTAPIESMYIKYSFLVILPKINKPQTYNISIRFASRVAIEKRLNKNVFAVPPKIISLMGNRTAIVEIEYVDYMVARNLLHIFDEWFKTVPKSEPKKFLRALQRNSYWIPRLLTLFSVTFMFYVIISIMPEFVPTGESDLLGFGRFIAFAILGVYIVRTLSFWLGRAVEDSVDLWSNISYIKITKGDELCIEEAERSNKKSLLKGVFSFLGALSISITAKILAALLATYIMKG